MTHAATPGRGRYVVERTLGRGGMATEYLARDTVLGRTVALKVLAEHLAGDESFRARFLREARLAARVAHPNVVQVYDAGGDEGACSSRWSTSTASRSRRSSRVAGSCPPARSSISGASSPPPSPRRTPPASSTAT
jgi:hypothetical protein